MHTGTHKDYFHLQTGIKIAHEPFGTTQPMDFIELEPCLLKNPRCKVLIASQKLLEDCILMWFIFPSWLSGGTHPQEAALNDCVITFEPLVKGWFSAIEFRCLIWNFCFVAVYKLRSLPVQTQLSSKPGGVEMKIRTVLRFFPFSSFFFLMRSVRHGLEFAATCKLSPESQQNLNSSRVPRPWQCEILVNVA